MITNCFENYERRILYIKEKFVLEKTKGIELEKQVFYATLQDSWEKFIEGQSMNTGEIREIIFDSWHSSVKNGISPFQKKVNRVLTEKEIIDNEKLNRNLIEVSLPVLENLFKFVAGSGFIVTLTDCRGIILKIVGDQEVVNSMSKGNFIVGADWSRLERRKCWDKCCWSRYKT